MRIVALISGGKDSTFNMMACVSEGHEIVALANLHPASDEDELDSFMYQTVGHMGIEAYAEAMELPLYRRKTYGKTDQNSKTYQPVSESDEVEDLFRLLKDVKDRHQIQAVAVGAILSDYQRVRCENVCSRLQLSLLAYLWQRDQVELLQEMIDANVNAILIKVACLGLDCKKHLGANLSTMQSHLLSMKEKYGVNVCGEGGEYETFTLDCPLFKKQIVIDEHEIVITSSDPICPVGHMNFKKLHLEAKETESIVLKMRKSEDFLTDIIKDDNDEICDQSNNFINNLQAIDYICGNKMVNSSNGWHTISGIQGIGETMQQGVGNMLEKFEKILHENSLDITETVFVTLYISRMSDFLELNEIYVRKFNFQNPPSRVCLETVLPRNCQIIAEFLLYQPRDSLKIESLHVQGISHWAPANIGPYSQSKKVKNLVFISGQIGLIPGNMKLINGTKNQNQLTLRHVKRVGAAMGCSDDIFCAICFLVHPDDIETVKLEWDTLKTRAISHFVVISNLPRNARVEWQVQCCINDGDFESEESTHEIGSWSILKRKRSNSEYICESFQVSSSSSSREELLRVYEQDEIEEILIFIMQSLGSSIFHMKFFYKIFQDQLNYFENTLKKLDHKYDHTITIVPSVFVENKSTILSVNAIHFK